MIASEIRSEIEDDEGNELDNRTRKKSKRRNRLDEPAMLTAPNHVHHSEWKDMLAMSDVLTQGNGADDRKPLESPRSFTKQVAWIEQNIKKRECIQFVPSHKYLRKCGCGRHYDVHSTESKRNFLQEVGVYKDGPKELKAGNVSRQRWSIKKHTELLPTDAYGTINFEGCGHHSMARYARVSFETAPDQLIRLLQGAWKMTPPKLIITIHGGLSNFDLQPKIGRALRRGLIKAAQSTDVWILTTGLHQGVVKHISDALADLKGNTRKRSKVNIIGIAPWGLIRKRHRLIGQNADIKYVQDLLANGKLSELDDSHSHFILADNGTVGRYGAEIILRRQLETLLATGTAPVVALLVEGGCFSVKLVHDYLTMSPAIPVVICGGSGRASDLLSYVHSSLKHDNRVPNAVREQLLKLVNQTFGMDDLPTNTLLRQIIECAKIKKLMTIFRVGEGIDDVDHAIFSALIKGTKMDQIRLALAFNRVDIARTQIFKDTFEWSQYDMHRALMYALQHDYADFAHLILEKGVNMHNFLTFERLEELYNSDKHRHHTLPSIMQADRFTLPEIGYVIERLIGRGYRSSYTSEEFLKRYDSYKLFKNQSRSIPNNIIQAAPIRKRNKDSGEYIEDEDEIEDEVDNIFAFEQPFHELLIWAVLTKRQKMAMMMWRHGDEGLAKALIATRLYMSLANSAADDYLEFSLCTELRFNGEQFRKLACELLDFCFKIDDDWTTHLLTYELTNWGSMTCLNLAASLHDRQFMIHPCPQALLSELWHGGMEVKSNSNLMIILGILCPPLILFLKFKSKEELRHQPHVAREHESDDETDTESSYSSDYTVTDYEVDSDEEKSAAKGIAIRKSFRKSNEPKEPQTINQLAAHTLPGLFQTAGFQSPISPGGVAAPRPRTSTIQKAMNKRNDGVAGKIARKASRSPSIATGRKTSDIWDTESEKCNEETEKTPLPWHDKITEFYSAPITTFWLWVLGFAIFQIGLAYVLLIRTEENIRWEEFYLFAYVLVTGCELIRKFVYYNVHPIGAKLYKFFWAFKNGTSLIAVITYIIGFIFRCIPETMVWGRVILVANSFLWSFKFIELLSVNRHVGPLVPITAKMALSSVPFIVLMSITMFYYGTVRQSIKFPDEDFDWILVRNIFIKTYYMLYGEVYPDDIDSCNDGIWNAHIESGIPIAQMNGTDPSGTCVPGAWVSSLYMTFFMLIGHVLILNTIIASCTWVYEHLVDDVKQIYLLERFRHVSDYNSMPSLPPPLTIFSHIYLFIRYCLAADKKKFLDKSFKSYLSPDRLKALHRFESECLEEMERKREFNRLNSQQENVNKTVKMNHQITEKLSSRSSLGTELRDTIREMEQRMSRLEEENELPSTTPSRFKRPTPHTLDILENFLINLIKTNEKKQREYSLQAETITMHF